MYQFAVYLHILSAMVWVGGLAFLALVAVPATRSLPPPERRAVLVAAGQRFRVVGWACIGLLLVSGLVISGYRGVTWAALIDGSIVASPFGQLLVVKVSLVAAMVALTLAHDLWLGPASARALAQSDAAAEAARRRLARASSWTARLSLLLAPAVIFLAVALVRGLP